MTGVAKTSPTFRSSGTLASATTMSPVSQCLPTRRTACGALGPGRPRQERLVAAAVEDGAGVVAHPAVDRDVGPHAGQALDRPDAVQRDAGGRDDRPSRFGRHPHAGGDAHSRAGRLGRVGPLGQRRRALTVHIGDAEAATHDELGQVEGGEERSQDLGRPLEGRHVEDLAADVGVDTDQLDPGHQLERGNGGRRGAGGHREAELRVLLAGLDELVRVGLDPRRHPHEYPGTRRTRGGIRQFPEARDLVEVVDDDAAHAGRQGRRQLRLRLVVAVHHEAIGGDAGGQRDRQLARRRHVEAHPLLVGQPGHGLAQERLGRVGHTVSPGRDRLPAALPEVRLVVDEQRRAVLLRQGEQVHPADREPTVVGDPRGGRQQVSCDRSPGEVRHRGRRTSSRHGVPCSHAGTENAGHGCTRYGEWPQPQ